MVGWGEIVGKIVTGLKGWGWGLRKDLFRLGGGTVFVGGGLRQG